MQFERTQGGSVKDPGYVQVTESVVNVGTTATTLIAANPERRYLLMQNISDSTVEYRLDGSDPVHGAAFLLSPGGYVELSYQYDNLVTGAIKGIQAAGGTKRVIVAEGV